MNSPVDASAKIIWEYMLLHQPLRQCDAIFLLGSRDERTAEYAINLYLRGYGEKLIISGGIAQSNVPLNSHWANQSQAEYFGKKARRSGVPSKNLVLEPKAANTGQNIEFTYKLLAEKDIKLSSILLVQKPYMERRTYATFMKQWPEPDIDITLSSPPIPYDEYFDDQNPKEDILNVMVGDLQRIKEYPRLGFQIEQEIPGEVWRAYEYLVTAGYTKHLIAKPE